jgi:serine O-acetyltransferase
MAFHRLGHYLYVRKLTLVSDALYLVCFILTGVEIAPSAQIGGGFVLFHTSAMAVSGRIGRNVVLSSRTVMGTDGSTVDVGGGPGLPVLGDNVYVGANSLILGPRRIGSNVVIYANSVITRDVPDGGRMFGIPARLINAARLSRGRVATRATFVPLAGTTAAPVEDPKE